MEHLAFLSVLEKLAPYGVPGIMAFLWWLSIRSLKEAYAGQNEANNKILAQYEKTLDFYKADLSSLADKYHQALREMRQKYDNNVRLVEMYGVLTERYGDMAEDLKKLIQTNIQCWQQTLDTVGKRAYCPYPPKD